jgi:hypothetical protein
VSDEERKAVAADVIAALDGLEGTHHEIGTEPDWFADIGMYTKVVPEAPTAGLAGEWPAGRYVWKAADSQTYVHINSREHVEVLGFEFGGDFNTAAGNVQKILTHLEQKLAFAKDGELGYLNSSPADIGSGLKCSVHIKVGKDVTAFNELVS